MARHRYRRKPGTPVIAIQLKLDMPGFSYFKWKRDQRCKAGDWLVDNDGDVYTVDADTFAKTYREQQRGSYVKTGCVWAEEATEDGQVATKEGHTAYAKGDFLVSNNEDGSDAYAIEAAKFGQLYERDE
ncbi:hypothetical protein [Aquabacterium humicola]|uniref:hypothetical protein n=1 Tax=Aquabacterium humicola TaxID=3237377 RepID=UPI0025433B43|nr:hypothetical protein [Rubrivivax pictus]